MTRVNLIQVTVLTIELSKFGKEALRRNERSHQVAETEADTWLQIARIDDDLAKSLSDSDKQMLEHARTRVRSNLSQRSKMLHDLPEYRTAILQILKFPGLRKHLRAQSMEIFLRGRTILVYSLFFKLRARSFKSPHEMLTFKYYLALLQCCT